MNDKRISVPESGSIPQSIKNSFDKPESERAVRPSPFFTETGEIPRVIADPTKPAERSDSSTTETEI